MKKCVHCGAELNNKAVVCIKCGYLQNNLPQEPVYKAIAPAAEEDFLLSEMMEDVDVPAVVNEPVVPAAPAPVPAVSRAPAGQLKTNRGLFKFIFLSLLTFGIYGIVVMSAVSSDINIIAGRYDGKKTMHYCLIYFIFSWLTLGIAPLVWSHRLCGRIGGELNRRGISYRFGSGTFWGWGFFGTLILIGPFIYAHKLLKSMNLLAAHYNVHG